MASFFEPPVGVEYDHPVAPRRDHPLAFMDPADFAYITNKNMSPFYHDLAHCHPSIWQTIFAAGDLAMVLDEQTNTCLPMAMD